MLLQDSVRSVKNMVWLEGDPSQRNIVLTATSTESPTIVKHYFDALKAASDPNGAVTLPQAL